MSLVSQKSYRNKLSNIPKILKNIVSNKNLLYFIAGLELFIIIVILPLIFTKKIELFEITSDINSINKPTNMFKKELDDWTNPKYEKNRTKLYGSLFLENLNKQIKNMTDPKIQYDNKQIDIIKYNDILL
jgi:hypothetical protein